MKSIEWWFDGMAPSYDERIKKSGKPSPRYEKWAKACIEKIGRISAPIGYIDFCEVQLSYKTYLSRTNSDRASSVHDMLIRAGVIKSASFEAMPDTRQSGRYSQNYPGIRIKMRIDNSHPLNKDVKWREFPVVKEWV